MYASSSSDGSREDVGPMANLSPRVTEPLAAQCITVPAEAAQCDAPVARVMPTGVWQ